MFKKNPIAKIKQKWWWQIKEYILKLQTFKTNPYEDKTDKKKHPKITILMRNTKNKTRAASQKWSKKDMWRMENRRDLYYAMANNIKDKVV